MGADALELDERIVRESDALYSSLVSYICTGVEAIEMRMLLPWMKAMRAKEDVQEQEKVNEAGEAIQRHGAVMGVDIPKEQIGCG